MDYVQLTLLLAILGITISTRGGTHQMFHQKQSKKVVLDSCGLIDGRIIPLAESGFLAAELVIPQFVINEMQLLADGGDAHKRERARFGLDVANELLASDIVRATICREKPTQEMPTDNMLMWLAKKLHASLYTIDFNLGKVASTEDIAVLNVNDLILALRPVTLPGEVLKIKIVQKGSGRDQGIGYLEDGTMIVVDGAGRKNGAIVQVVVTKMHQTRSGKMVFGQIKRASTRE